MKGGIIGIEGVTFQYGYLSNNDAKSNECGSGIYINGNVNSTSVELTDCIIRDCKTEAVNGQGRSSGRYSYSYCFRELETEQCEVPG